MAEALGAAGDLASALNNIGTSRAGMGDDSRDRRPRAGDRDRGAANNVHEHGRAIINLAVIMVLRGDLARAYELELLAGDVARAGGEASAFAGPRET